MIIIIIIELAQSKSIPSTVHLPAYDYPLSLANTATFTSVIPAVLFHLRKRVPLYAFEFPDCKVVNTLI